jgi:hypothetical protein
MTSKNRAAFVVVVLLLLFIAFSAVAPVTVNASATAADLVPADFAGFIRLQMTQPADTLQGLNIAYFTASRLQPPRLTFTQVQSLDTFLPLDLLDMEDASFTTDILPWLGDEMVVAYKRFNSQLQAGLSDALLILPTTNMLNATTSLERIIRGQDLKRQDTYQGTTLFIGDKSTIAITIATVFIGPEDLVREALDVQAGAAPPMTDSAAYAAIAPSTSGDTMIFGFVDGSQAIDALNFAVGGDNGGPLLAALGQALPTLHSAGTLESMLLDGQLDGVGVAVQPDTTRAASVDTTVTLFSADPPNQGERLSFDTRILDMVPRNVMAVVSGPDAQTLAYEGLALLPLANFAGKILKGFPITESAGAASGVLPLPTADDITTAAQTFLAGLKQSANVDLENDLFAHLKGSYSIALLPRPNDPNLLLNTPFDILLLAQVDDGDAALAGAKELFGVFFGSTSFTDETVQGQTFSTLPLPATGEPLLRLGVVNNTLMIATGNSADFALDALRGDNRLTSQARWQALDASGGGETVPYVYLDIRSLYNTFQPQAGGSREPGVSQLGISVSSPADGVFQLHMLVTLPSQ